MITLSVASELQLGMLAMCVALVTSTSLSRSRHMNGLKHKSTEQCSKCAVTFKPSHMMVCL